MDRKYRLRGSTNFKRVRQQGTAFVHPLFVLIVHPNQSGRVRIGVAAGRSIGNAVQRNRAKRRLRAGIQPFLEHIRPGVDLVILARKAILEAKFSQITRAMAKILEEQSFLINESETIASRNSS